MFELPEKAIRCFEQWSRTSVAIHGYSSEYEFMLNLDRTKHQHHFCMSFKSTPPGSHCREIDMKELSVAAHYYRNGGIKRCHAGVLEFFMPIWNGIQLQAILFAGIRQAPEKAVIYGLKGFMCPECRVLRHPNKLPFKILIANEQN